MRVAPALSGFVVALLSALTFHMCTANLVIYETIGHGPAVELATQGIVDVSAFAVGFILGVAGVWATRGG